MKSKPFIPSSPQRPSRRAGFTLLELMLATVIGLVIIGVSIALVLSNRRVYDLDRARTELNQNLRSSMDVLGVDIRQAGELLPPNFPAILIANGTSGQPDQLIVRRNRLEPLTVCQVVESGTTAGVVVADSNINQSGCSKLGSGMHEPLGRWESYRLANGVGDTKTLDAYIFNPSDKTGEFFSFIGTENDTTLRRGGGSWLRNYPLGSQVYILEERAYRLNGNVLELRKQNTNPEVWQGVANGISDLQLSADLKSGATTTTVDSLDPSSNWVDIQGITVRITGKTSQRTTLTRTLEAQFLPRNARWQ